MENTKIESGPQKSYGMKHIDYWNLSTFEAVTMSIVAVLAVTLGTILVQTA